MVTIGKKSVFFPKKSGIVREETVNIVEYKDIGKVYVTRKASVRNLKIVIKPLKGVQVIIPAFMTMENALRFVEEKIPWIKKSQMKLKKLEHGITVFDEHTVFKTNNHMLILDKHQKPTLKTVISLGEIRVTFPDYADIRDSRIQKVIRKAVHKAWLIEAKVYLPQRLQLLSNINGLHYSGVTIRDNKTRWGSCSGDNRISLNIHLMRLPQHLCDYIILHELCHTVHKHHQKAFWVFLNQLTVGKARELDKELNHYAPQIW
jgi:predicted metal-dependent hydrolase